MDLFSLRPFVYVAYSRASESKST